MAFGDIFGGNKLKSKICLKCGDKKLSVIGGASVKVRDVYTEKYAQRLSLNLNEELKLVKCSSCNATFLYSEKGDILIRQ